MPHFIIECSPDIVEQHTPREILDTVYDLANATGLFAPNDIKVRIQPFENFKLAETKKNFLHIFAYIMEGRSPEQKAALARKIVSGLTPLFPDISFLSMNVEEFHMATYCNKSMIDPDNKANDRHFGL